MLVVRLTSYAYLPRVVLLRKASSQGRTFVTNFVGNKGMQVKLANLATFGSLGKLY